MKKNKFIYKYYRFDYNFEDSIQNSYLWFSEAKNFNDPFEFSLQGPKDLTDEEILEYYHLMKTLGGSKIDEILQGHVDAFIFAFRHNPEKFLDYYLIPFKKRIEKFGICCFSEKYDENLMWSHYSDSHRGIVIKFDMEKLDKSIYYDNELVSMTVIDSVNYLNSFPLIKLSSDLQKAADSIKKILFTKSLKWKYEKEVRILSTQIGRNYFDIDCIEEIILGLNILRKDEEKLSRMVNLLNRKSQILISKMSLSKRKFKLEKSVYNIF